MVFSGERIRKRASLAVITVVAALAAGTTQAIENLPAEVNKPTASEQHASNPDYNVAPSTPSQTQDASNALFAAAKEAGSGLSLGPVTACFNQLREFACPIVGNIPVIGEFVGMISLELGISCPTGNSKPNRS